MIGKTMDEIKVGDTAQLSKTVTEEDVYLFAGVTGDLNPSHLSEAFARNTFFKARIAHGVLAGGFISAVLGMHLPGPGTIYIRQELNFLAPVRFGDTITAKVRVIEKIPGKNRLRLRTTCTNQEGTMVVDGEALVSPPTSPKS
jgi:3-hydroxybutyryl-CoA dehydratase